MVLWWMRSTQVRKTQSLPEVWEEMIEENGEPPQPVITVKDPSGAGDGNPESSSAGAC